MQSGFAVPPVSGIITASSGDEVRTRVTKINLLITLIQVRIYLFQNPDLMARRSRYRAFIGVATVATKSITFVLPRTENQSRADPSSVT